MEKTLEEDPVHNPNPVPLVYRSLLYAPLLMSVLVGSTLAAQISAASDPIPDLTAAVEAVTPEIVEIRHWIHQNPELGNREIETARRVAEHLRALGLEVTTGVAHTGVVGILRGGLPGPVVAVRADMDALPVTERTDLPFKSTRRTEYLGQEVGVAHACGHDIHTSVALGVASVLASMRDELPGTVEFLFQPAEEGPPPGEDGGARLMIEEGVLDDEPRPEAIFGLHSFPDLEVGQLGYQEGPAMAAVDHFLIDLEGKQSHGAYPHLSVDPIVMAAQAVMALQTIRSRNLPALEPSVVTVGIVRGGERFNIIPGSVHLEGTVRTFRPEIREQVERRIREILDGVTRAAGGSFEMEYRSNAPATINDPDLARRVRPAMERAVGAENVIEVEPTMAGEDFAYFAQKIPGFYFRLGVVAPGTESGGLHTPTFRASDDAIPVGIRAMASMVLAYLEGGR
jgi:amidohydrolase